VEKESLFVNEMPITTNNSKNHYNKKDKLDNSIYISRTVTGNEILKDIQIFEGIASYQISDNENSPINSILIEI
jgi:hypothetical protein